MSKFLGRVSRRDIAATLALSAVMLALLLPLAAFAESAAAYLQKGSAEFAQGDFRAAERYYRRAVELGGNPHALFGLAHTQVEQGRLSEAQASLQQLTSRYPDFEPAYYLLGRLYDKQGQREQARQAFQNYISKSRGQVPPDPEVRIQLRKYGLL